MKHDTSSIADNEQFASDVMARFGLNPDIPVQQTDTKSNFIIDRQIILSLEKWYPVGHDGDEYWYPGQRYDMIDLPNDITGRVDVWNQTLQANYNDDDNYDGNI